MLLLNQKKANYLLGLLQGLYVNKAFSNTDATFFLKRLKEHSELLDEKPLSSWVIFFKNQIETNDHSLQTLRETRQIMAELLGVEVDKHRRNLDNPSFQKIPYSEIYEIVIASNSFVLSGIFTINSRKKVEDYIEKNDGHVQKRCTRKTDYLIVGDKDDPSWVNGSNGGRKIEKAFNYEIPIIPVARFLELTDNLK